MTPCNRLMGWRVRSASSKASASATARKTKSEAVSCNRPEGHGGPCAHFDTKGRRIIPTTPVTETGAA